MLIRYMMKRSDDAALEQAVVALGEIRMEDDSPHKRLAVVDHMVAMEVLV